MTLRILLRLVMVVSCCVAVGATAQSESGNMKDRVLNILFSSEAPTSPFLTKMTLRFGDSDTQLVVLIHPVYPAHPGGRAEVLKYSIAGTENRNLSAFIAEMVAQKPNVTEREIASKLKVEVAHVPVNYDALQHSMKALETLRISPVLKSRVAVDEYSQYDYWFDNGQEFVHYSITGPFKTAAQDQLVAWMIKFKMSLPVLAKSPSAPKP
jgi:hypothetical protein